MPSASINGIDLHYELVGAGPRLLFVNGSGATVAGTAPLLRPLLEHFEVLAYDQRGLGETEIPPGPYAMADYAADAIGLLDHVGWETTPVMGISFGGMVALELAVTVPDRIERLALLCTSAGGAGGSSYPLHELTAMAVEDRIRTNTEIMDTRFTPAYLAEHPRDAAIVQVMTGRHGLEKSDEVRRGEALQLEARRHHDTWDRLGAITCPTFVAAGRYDGIAPLPNSEGIAARIAGSELHVYEGGHAFFIQDRTAFPEVIGFLSEAAPS